MTSAALTEYLLRQAKKSNPAAARLAAFLLANRSFCADSTLSALADAAGVSYATVCRFVRGTDCSWKTFRTLLRDIPALPVTDTPGDAVSDGISCDIACDIIRRVCDMTVSMAENCRRAVDDAALERAADAILHANQLVIAGLGTSAVTAHYAYIKLFRLGLLCSWDTDMIVMRMKASLLRRGDVLFAVSSSGRTKAMLEIAELARLSGAAVISLCDYAGSPLSEVSDLAVSTTARQPQSASGEDLPLIQGQLTVIDMLYARLFGLTGGQGFARTKDSVRSVKEP